MKHISPLAILLGAIALILCMFRPIGLRANMAAPVEPGNQVGEPSGQLRDIDILRERLTIDARGLANGGDALVDALYHVRNGGAGGTIDMLFVAVALIDSTSEIWIDGRRVEGSVVGDDVPLRWRPPMTTPSISGAKAPVYEVRDTMGIHFPLFLPAGEHEIRVRYRARVTANHLSDDPVRLWQLAYVLSPARDWRSFGGLDFTLLLPAGWRLASNPPLERSEVGYVGHWADLPGDAIALTMQAPAASSSLSTASDIALTILLTLGFAYGCISMGRMLGRWLVRKGRTVALAGPAALLAGVVWSVAIFIGGTLYSSSHVDPLQQSHRFGYVKMIMTFGYAILAFVVGAVLTQVAATVAARRARRPAGDGAPGRSGLENAVRGVMAGVNSRAGLDDRISDDRVSDERITG